MLEILLSFLFSSPSCECWWKAVVFFFKGCSNCALMKDDAMSEELDDVSFYHDNDLLSTSNVYS